MRVILISGHAEHGKDYVGHLIESYLDKHDKAYRTIHFADLVKYVCSQYWHWDGKKDDAGRTLLQQIGTDRRINFDPTIWAEITARLARFIGFDCDYVIVPDWRFVLEHKVMKEYFGDDLITIRVNRWNDLDYTIPYENHLSPEQRKHPSECELDNMHFDYYLDNCAILQYNNNEDLEYNIHAMFQLIGEKLDD